MTVVGSESLRAPEVILQAGYGPEIDIWAIGCTVRVFLEVVQEQRPMSDPSWSGL